MDNQEWNSEALPQKVYKDPVQSGVRTIIGRALVEAFDLFKYDLNNDTGRYVPQLPLCQESLIHEVIALCDETGRKCYVQLVKEGGTTERRRKNSIGGRMW